ncbi:MAG: glycosyltransferase [Candidatus Woesearchaeota archaeon]
MDLVIYSGVMHEVMGGGANSTRTTIKYLEKAGHKVKCFENIYSLRKYLSFSKPDLLLHHNIKELNSVYNMSIKHNVPMIVTINNLITCMTGVHMRYGSKFGTPCYNCNFLDSIICQFKEKNVRNLREKTMALLSLPFRYFTHKRRIAILNKVSGVIAISPTLKKLLIENGVNRHIDVCPQPIDNDFLKLPNSIPKSNKKNILYVGGGEPFKGIRVLLEAFNKLNRDDVNLLIAGDIRESNHLDLFKIQKRNSNILFLGQLSAEELKNYYYLADIFVFPSLWLEAYGRAWAEAACCGKPILAFKGRGGASDYLKHMETGYLVDTNTISVIKGLNTLLKNSDLRYKIGKSAKSFALNNLIASKVISKLENLFQKSISH